MEIGDWRPAIVGPNKFEAHLLADALRNAGVTDAAIFTDPRAGLDAGACRSNVVLTCFADNDQALDWVRNLRRSVQHPARKAPVFAIVGSLTLALAERFRHAGANAIIGKPLSTALLVNTIRKVLAKPRPFVEGVSYVGPCRRAGIVTADGAKRRRSDATLAKA